MLPRMMMEVFLSSGGTGEILFCQRIVWSSRWEERGWEGLRGVFSLELGSKAIRDDSFHFLAPLPGARVGSSAVIVGACERTER